MDIESVLPVLLAFVSLFAFELGTRVRAHIHVVLPHRDPVTLLLVLLCVSPCILDLYGHRIIDPGSIWYVSFVFAFLSCYVVAYLRGEFDLVYVNVHTIISERFPNGAQEVRPIVYYWDSNGRMCIQEQTYKEVIKSLLGIRSTLRLDVGMVRRTRPVYVQKVLFPMISVEAIDVVEERIEEEVVRRGPFRFRIRHYEYVPAPSSIDTTQSWLVSAYNQEQLTRELTRKESQLLEAKLTAQSQYYARSADLLVEMISDRTPGSEVYRDVIDRLRPDAPEERRVPDGIVRAEEEASSGTHGKGAVGRRKA